MRHHTRSIGNLVNAVIIWVIATAFVIYAFMLNTAAAVFLPSVKESLQLSSESATAAMSMLMLSYGLMQIPAGYLLDNFRARLIVSASILFLVLGVFLEAIAFNVEMFILAKLIEGIGGAFAFISAGALIGQWFPVKQFPIWFGLTQTASGISVGFIQSYLTKCLVSHTWHEVYVYLGGIGVVIFMLSLIFIRNPKGYIPEAQSFVKPIAQVCKNRQVWLCGFIAAFSFGVLIAYGSYWVTDVQKSYNVDNVSAAAVTGFVFAGIGIGAPLLGWLSNLIKSRKAVLHVTICIGTIMMILALYLPHFDTNTLILSKVVAFGAGFFLTGSMLLYTCVGEIMPNNLRGIALGLVNMLVFVVCALVASIPNLFSTSKVYYTSLWVFPALLVVSLLLLYYLKETYPKEKG